MAVRPDNVDFYLDTLIGTWTGAVDDYIAEWDTYDGDEKFIHIEDFGSTTARQADLDEYARTHRLTPAQAGRYRELLDLIASKHEKMSAMGFRLWSLATPRVHGRARRVA